MSYGDTLMIFETREERDEMVKRLNRKWKKMYVKVVFLMKVGAIVPLEEFFEELSWNCVRRDDYIELRRETPLGEDWGFNLLYFDGTFKSLKEQVEYQFREFDVEKEAGKLICARGKYGVPSSICDLYEDAEWKRAKLEGLLGVLQTFAWIERISNGSDD